jgi:hypothetical protein
VGETRELFAIYGAVDRAVAGDSEPRERVAQLIPFYRDPDFQWFDEFEAWAKEGRPAEPALRELPSLDQALKSLAGVEPRGRTRARRLWAVALAVRADPGLLEGDRASLAAAALRVPGLADEDEERARGLLELLGKEDLIPVDQAEPDPDTWWDELLKQAEDQGFLAAPRSLGPRPCIGRLVDVQIGTGAAPVATLRSYFETNQVTFDKAIKFLDPEVWPHCSDFWCDMQKVGEDGGIRHYHETCGFDCTPPYSDFTIEADLDFSFRKVGNSLAITSYQMSAGHPDANDRVVVDEGSLLVRRAGTGAAARIQVTTTKRVRFDHPFSGEALAMIMCALGYASVVEDLVFTCALDPAARGKAFPSAGPSPKKAGIGAAPLGGPPDLGPVIKAIATEASDAIKTCVDDMADAAQESSEKIAQGKYTTDDLVHDMARGWVRLMREGTSALNLGVRGGRAVRARVREPARS